jgi:hypothetical protein
MEIEEEFYDNTTQTVLSYSVYVAELEGDNYFVFLSPSENTQEQLLFECEMLYDFPKIHYPIRIRESRILHEDAMDVDYVHQYLKKYMLQYGTDHVRGGAYSNLVFTKDQKQALEIELYWLSQFSLGIEMHPDEFQRKTFHKYVNDIIEMESIDSQREILEQAVVKYKEKNEELERILTVYSGKPDPSDFLTSSIFYEIECLQDSIMNCTYRFTDCDELSIQNFPRERYFALICTLKKITRTFDTLFAEEEKIEEFSFPPIYLKNPEFVFDHYFLHYQTPRFKEYDISVWVTMCDVFREMTTIILKRVNELKEELVLYPANMEQMTRTKEYLLKSLSEIQV